VGRKIFAAAREHPQSPSLIALRGFVRSRIGDFESALDDLLAGGDEAGLPEEMRIALSDALFHTGDAGGALQVAESLISDEFESPAIYSMAAQAAEVLGRADDSLFYAKQAFRRDRGNLGAALRALKVAVRQGDAEQVAEWRAEILENLADAINGALEVCLWAIDNADDAMFSAAIGAVGSYDKAGAVDLVEKASEAGMSRAVADAIVMMANLGRLEPALAHRRADLIQWVLDESARLLEAGQPVEAYHLSQSFAGLEGIPSSQLRIDRVMTLAARHRRIVERHLRAAIRNAFTEGDQATVIRLGEEARQVLPNDADTAVIVARALHLAERNGEAINLLVGAQRANPDHWLARRWLARLAAMEPVYAIALPHYGAISRSRDPAAVAFHPEAERFLERAGRRAFRQMRELWAEGRYEDSIILAEEMRDENILPDMVEREFGRMHRLLRIRLREIEQEETDLEEREPILRLMDRIKPDDEAVLRRLALEFMRQFRFGEAADYWERLDAIKPNNETVLRNRQKCRILAERRAKSSITEVAA
jgi:tetratricopeptide (TPR) repeat protein